MNPVTFQGRDPTGKQVCLTMARLWFPSPTGKGDIEKQLPCAFWEKENPEDICISVVLDETAFVDSYNNRSDQNNIILQGPPIGSTRKGVINFIIEFCEDEAKIKIWPKEKTEPDYNLLTSQKHLVDGLNHLFSKEQI